MSDITINDETEETGIKLAESGEMYLETIYVLSQSSSNVRAVDICEYMGYSRPSVSRALSVLKKGNYISVDASGKITLLDSGREIAEKIYRTHTFLTDFLVSIGVDKTIAAADACKIEHCISDVTLNALKNFNDIRNGAKNAGRISFGKNEYDIIFKDETHELSVWDEYENAKYESGKLILTSDTANDGRIFKSSELGCDFIISFGILPGRFDFTKSALCLVSDGKYHFYALPLRNENRCEKITAVAKDGKLTIYDHENTPLVEYDCEYSGFSSFGFTFIKSYDSDLLPDSVRLSDITVGIAKE